MPSIVSPSTWNVGFGTAPAGNRTELAPSCQSQLKKLPGFACSTMATKISASPIVEISAEMGGAFRRRSGRSATNSISSPSKPQTSTAMTAAGRNGMPWSATNE